MPLMITVRLCLLERAWCLRSHWNLRTQYSATCQYLKWCNRSGAVWLWLVITLSDDASISLFDCLFLEACWSKPVPGSMGIGKGAGRLMPPRFWNLTFSCYNFSKKVVFLVSRRKDELSLLSPPPPWKNLFSHLWKNPQYPPGKKSFRRPCQETWYLLYIYIYTDCVRPTFFTGKSALHWAAAVNNVDAVAILLRNNCNRDAQTEREETPLYLAAREGSYEAVRLLLDHYANRDITDHMDRWVKSLL